MTNTVYGLFEEIVTKQPEAAAIIENKRMMKFKELSKMVDMIADSFPDDTKAVVIVMRHRAEMNHLDSIPSSLRLLISGGDVLRGHHVNNLLDAMEENMIRQSST